MHKGMIQTPEIIPEIYGAIPKSFLCTKRMYVIARNGNKKAIIKLIVA